MSPYFPPPKQRGAYRVPGEPAPAERAPKRTIVSRPADVVPRAAPPAASALTVGEQERTFWMRHRLFVRHPRPVGGVLALLGGLATWSNVDVLVHGGFYWAKAAPLGPVALCAGLWPLLFGFPLQRGRPPAWWTLGYVVSIFVGIVAGATLLGLLSGSNAQGSPRIGAAMD